MSNLLYTIAVILIIFWAIGFFAYGIGSIIQHTTCYCNYCHNIKTYSRKKKLIFRDTQFIPPVKTFIAITIKR
ncbi:MULTISPECIES: lmo0937 family membrane protein [unclassified Flavobacterium]|uniref:lmo0937 family membrane protein n=1 Tax=unclassified Flavobacterium TaxID=196869 RepID=UPI0032E4652F